MATFSHVSVEVRPPSVTALIHVVACHQKLGTHHRHVLAILDLKSVLGNLCERDSIAAATVTLVTVITCKVIASHTSPIKVFRQSVVRDFSCIRILLLKLLSFIQSFGKLWTFSKLLGLLTESLGQVD